jgi:hypothetical protein
VVSKLTNAFSRLPVSCVELELAASAFAIPDLVNGFRELNNEIHYLVIGPLLAHALAAYFVVTRNVYLALLYKIAVR